MKSYNFAVTEDPEECIYISTHVAWLSIKDACADIYLDTGCLNVNVAMLDQDDKLLRFLLNVTKDCLKWSFPFMWLITTTPPRMNPDITHGTGTCKTARWFLICYIVFLNADYPNICKGVSACPATLACLLPSIPSHNAPIGRLTSYKLSGTLDRGLGRSAERFSGLLDRLVARKGTHLVERLPIYWRGKFYSESRGQAGRFNEMLVWESDSLFFGGVQTFFLAKRCSTGMIISSPSFPSARQKEKGARKKEGDTQHNGVQRE